MRKKQIVYLKTSQIKRSPLSLRSTLCPYELKGLALSIKAVGIIEPLLVRINEEGEYELVSGNRRLLAAQEVGILKIPCIVTKADQLISYVWAISENTKRQNLSPFEEAEALERLANLYSLSDDAAAQKLGISPSSYAFKRELLGISLNQRKQMESAGLDEQYARLLLKLPEFERKDALDKIIAEEMSFKEAEELVDQLLNPKKEKCVKTAIGDIRLFSNSLNKMIETMKLGGIKAQSQRIETDAFIEYKVTFIK